MPVADRGSKTSQIVGPIIVRMENISPHSVYRIFARADCVSNVLDYLVFGKKFIDCIKYLLNFTIFLFYFIIFQKNCDCVNERTLQSLSLDFLG